MGKNPSALYAAGVKDSLEIILRTFEGEPGDAHKIVAINAGAAIYLGGLASDLLSGIKKASDLLTTGFAKNNFQKFIRKTQELSQN